MSAPSVDQTPFKLDLNAVTEIFNPLTIPIFLHVFAPLFGFKNPLWANANGTANPFLGTIVLLGIGVTFFIVFSKKAWFQKWRLKSQGRAGLILLPLVMSILSFLFLFLSQLYHNWVFGFPEISIAMIIFPLAMFVRWFYNISLHQTNLGLIMGLATFSCIGTELSWVPLAILTVAGLLGRIHYGSKRYSILESVAGFLLGGVVGYLTLSYPALFNLEMPM